jgi:hypothetical protein
MAMKSCEGVASQLGHELFNTKAEETVWLGAVVSQLKAY